MDNKEEEDPEDRTNFGTNSENNRDNVNIRNNNIRANDNQRWRQNVNQPFRSRWNEQ